MRKVKQTIDVSRLVEFLHQTFAFTENVKHLLKSHCNEAIFSLKPWCMEVDNPEGFDKDVCTCPKAETEVEEIAAGISRTLLQTQQLREKLSSTVIKGKHSKRLDVSKVYNPQTAGDKKQEQKKDFNDKGINVVKENIKKINLNKGLKNKTAKEETKNYDKQSITNSGRSMKNKNFLAINKSNIKSMNEVIKRKNNNRKVGDNSKSSNSMTKLSYTKSDDKLSTTSTNELKSLIQKVSFKSDNYSSFNIHNAKCPLREDVVSQFKHEQNLVTVDVIDGINLCNVPGEVVKLLKVYHTYLNTEFSKKSINEKQSKAVNKFLTEFNEIDKTVQKTLIQKTHDISLLAKYMSFVQILSSKDVEVFNSHDVKTIYTELQFARKLFETKEFDDVQTFKSNTRQAPHSTSNLTEWMSNGIWNLSTIKNFKGISTVCCIRYTSKNRLLFFCELLQQLQQIHYHKRLIDTLLKEVLPNVKTFHSTQSEYVKIYKMMYILCQGLNPKVPVLVSTKK